MEYTQINYEVSDRILTITLNRPENLNSFTLVMGDELADALGRADEDDDIRVIIVTGAGRAFCAGADLDKSGDRFNYGKAQITLENYQDRAGPVALKIYDLKKPVIAAINGPAVGVGITMTLPMDIRLVSEKAKIGFVFARRGIVMEACSSWFLPRIVGLNKALEWVVTGRIFSAQEAMASGLVNEIVAPDALLPRAREIAVEIAQNTSAISVALCRQLLLKMCTADHPMEAHKLNSKCLYWTGQNADAREGILSFLEKRPAKFTMRPSSDMPEFYPWWTERPFKE